MESGQELQDLDKRVKRLENVHIWGVGLIIVGLLVFFLTKKSSGSTSMAQGGSIGDGVGGAGASAGGSMSGGAGGIGNANVGA